MSGSETESDSSQPKVPSSTNVPDCPFSKWDPRNPIWSSNPTSGSIEDVQALLQLDVPFLIEVCCLSSRFPAKSDLVMVEAGIYG